MKAKAGEEEVLESFWRANHYVSGDLAMGMPCLLGLSWLKWFDIDDFECRPQFFFSIFEQDFLVPVPYG